MYIQAAEILTKPWSCLVIYWSLENRLCSTVGASEFCSGEPHQSVVRVIIDFLCLCVFFQLEKNSRNCAAFPNPFFFSSKLIWILDLDPNSFTLSHYVNVNVRISSLKQCRCKVTLGLTKVCTLQMFFRHSEVFASTQPMQMLHILHFIFASTAPDMNMTSCRPFQQNVCVSTLPFRPRCLFQYLAQLQFCWSHQFWVPV